MEQATKAANQVRGVGRPPKPKEPSPAQVYALRIWEGQSPDLQRHERISRVSAGLAGQKLSMEGVVLPTTHDSKPDEEAEAKLRAWNKALPKPNVSIV
jgi:hypothetical protein